MEGILSQDDILSHVFASSCWFDPCWCFPYREPPPNQRPTPAIHLRLLFRLRLICHQWRAVIDEVVAQPHTALDHSGCRHLARWMEHGIPVAYIHMEAFLDTGDGSLAIREQRCALCSSRAEGLLQGSSYCCSRSLVAATGSPCPACHP